MNDTTATQTTRREPRGAVEYTGPRAKYLHIKHGCLCEESKKEVEGWQHITTTDQQSGQTYDKWIKVYSGLEAWVNDIVWYTQEHQGKEYSGWKLHMEAGGVNYVVDLPLNNRGTKRVLMCARNINFELPLEISAWTSRDDGKLAVNLKQDGQTVPQFYKKGDMKECPAPVEKISMGKKKWDWEATNDYLWHEMNDTIAPIVRSLAEHRGYKPAGSQDATPEYTGAPVGATEANTDDDIPF